MYTRTENPAGLLNIREAALRLDLSPFTLRHHCQKRRIAHYRIFGRIKFSIQQLEDFKSTSTREVLSPNSKRTKFHSLSR